MRTKRLAAATPRGTRNTSPPRLGKRSPDHARRFHRGHRRQQRRPVLAEQAERAGSCGEPGQPAILAAGANDNIDMEACNAGDDRTCPFTPGVGVSGVQFSTDGGRTWTQPTYTGLLGTGDPELPGPARPRARAPRRATDTGCVPDPAGPIGTLPNYFENGLVSNGDPELVFGPVPDADGDFSLGNGQRLYYANIATKFPGRQGFSGAGAIAVSRTDDIAGRHRRRQRRMDGPGHRHPAELGAVQRQGATLGRQRRVEPALRQRLRLQRGLPRYGGLRAGPLRELERRRRHVDGPGSSRRQRTTARRAAARAARSAPTATASCTWSGTAPTSGPVRMCSSRRARSTAEPTSSGHGRSCSRRRHRPVRPGAGSVHDRRHRRGPNQHVPEHRHRQRRPLRCRRHGPDPDHLVRRPAGTNNERAFVITSTNGGDSPTPRPINANDGADRANFPAIAISPDGTDAWLVYNAWLDPWRNDTTSPRRVLGVVRHAEVDADTGAIGAWTTLLRGRRR